MADNQPVCYTVRVRGGMDETVVDLFGPITISRTDDGEGMVSSLTVADQAALVGLIRYLHGLGVVLLTVERQRTAVADA